MMSIRSSKIACAMAFLFSVSCALFLATAAASAQDMDTNTRANDERESGPKGMDGKPMRGYGEFIGPYGQFGISIGRTDADSGSVDSEAQGGFNLTGGYRALPWLAAEGSLVFMRGELDGVDRDMHYYSFTFGPKLYPLGLLDDPILPEQFQPYMTIAIGAGGYEVENTSFDESTFIARFIWGFDWWMTDHLGAFVEGGYHAAGESDIDGTGIFTFGGQYRF